MRRGDWQAFHQLFAPRCTPHLSHLSEVTAGTLNCVCYMWWDEFPCIALPSDPNLPRLSGTALTTMEHILGLGSLACQESALHGFGHWQRQHASEVAAHNRRICLVTNGGGSATSRVCQRGAMWLRIVMHRAAANSSTELSANLVRRRYVPVEQNLGDARVAAF